jgi:hypothetical protein
MIVDANQPVYARLPIVSDRSFFPDEPKPILLQQPHKLAKSHLQLDKPSFEVTPDSTRYGGGMARRSVGGKDKGKGKKDKIGEV